MPLCLRQRALAITKEGRHPLPRADLLPWVSACVSRAQRALATAPALDRLWSGLWRGSSTCFTRAADGLYGAGCPPHSYWAEQETKTTHLFLDPLVLRRVHQMPQKVSVRRRRRNNGRTSRNTEGQDFRERCAVTLAVLHFSLQVSGSGNSADSLANTHCWLRCTLAFRAYSDCHEPG